MEAAREIKPQGLGGKIDFLATEAHFLSHIAPVWLELDKSRQGTFYTRPDFFPLLEPYGIKGKDFAEMRGHNLTYVAAWGDLKKARKAERLCVLTEHGTGQSYQGVKSPSYIGAVNRAGVLAVFVPAAYQAEKHLAVHPSIPVYPIGCPKMDKRWSEKKRPGRKRLVVFSTHWDCKVAPETRSSITHFRRALPELAMKFNLAGHAHPRIARQMQSIYGKYGIEWIESFDQVMDEAALYITDNSSSLYEFASLDRPVVVLNAPWYRRNIEHGLRFWEFADIGINCDHPRELVDAVRHAFVDPCQIADRRREIIKTLYGEQDGQDAKRAALTLMAVHDKWK